MKDLSKIERGNLNATQRDFLDRLQKSGWRSMAEAARELGKTRSYVTRVLNGEVTPSKDVMEVLGMRIEGKTYPRKEEVVIIPQEETGIIERARAKFESEIGRLGSVLPLPVISWAGSGSV